jgi:hypothetical protein
MLWILVGLAELAFRSWTRSNSPQSCLRRDGAFTSWIGWLAQARYSGSGVAHTSAGRSLERREQHRRLIAATLRQTTVDAAVSHMSAAVLHQLPIWNDQLARVHITRDGSGGGKVRRYVHLHVAPLRATDMCDIEGQRVTTLARTVLDLLRTLTMERSVAIGDTALRLGLTLEDLAEVAGRCIGWRGMLQARRAIKFLDPRSESPGESYSRVVLHRMGVPAPTAQYEVWEREVLVGRVDFCWEELRPSGSSMARRSTGDYSRLDGRRPIQSSRRSAARMRCSTSAGRSSAGSGRTSVTPRTSGAAWSAPSRGVCERPDEPTLHLFR